MRPDIYDRAGRTGLFGRH